MHPAYSVIIFTTFSGAGFGLMAVLGLAAAFGPVAGYWSIGFVGLALAITLAVIGLLSSTFHLSHPERAWRAFSQWRTSWLSREGIAAVATLAAAGLLGLIWTFFPGPGRLIGVLGVIVAFMAVVTIYTTGMIYQSLPTIRAWHQPIVAPIYILLGVTSGTVIAHALLLSLAEGQRSFGFAAMVLLAASALAKWVYWSRVDRTPAITTAGSATGLGRFGDVRVLEWPHTQENFVMREMGYKVARKHAAQLRRSALMAAFAIPLLLVLVSNYGNGIAALAAAYGAVISMMAGLFVERWLFFAEAEHVVTTYYGAKAA